MSAQPSATDAPTRSLVGSATLWILQTVAAVGFLLAALQKVTGAPDAVATFQGLGWPDWTRYALADLEVLGLIALLIPKLTGLAASAFVALTVGALAAQVATGGSTVPALVLLVMSITVAWYRRQTTVAVWTRARVAFRRTPNRG